jgi:putative ABC transport system substrate-binding protein
MQRRRFITLLGSAAAIWPLTARAQQDQRVRRIGVLSSLAENDPESVARRPAFEQALKALGWTNGSNLRVDYRWSADDADAVANTRRNWSRSRPTSSSRPATSPWYR